MMVYLIFLIFKLLHLIVNIRIINDYINHNIINYNSIRLLFNLFGRYKYKSRNNINEKFT